MIYCSYAVGTRYVRSQCHTFSQVDRRVSTQEKSQEESPLVTIPFVVLELRPGVVSVDIWTVRLFPSVATVLTTNFYHIVLNALADQILIYKGLVTSLAFPFLQ